MPERKTLARAQADKRAGKSASTQAGEFVKEEMDHVRAGKHGVRSAKQAVATPSNIHFRMLPTLSSGACTVSVDCMILPLRNILSRLPVGQATGGRRNQARRSDLDPDQSAKGRCPKNDRRGGKDHVWSPPPPDRRWTSRSSESR